MRTLKNIWDFWSRGVRKIILIFFWLTVFVFAFRGGLELLAEQAPPHKRSYTEKLDNGCSLLYDGLDGQRHLICPFAITAETVKTTESVKNAPKKEGWGKTARFTFSGQ